MAGTKAGHDARALDFRKTPESAISAQHLLVKNRIVCYRFPMIGTAPRAPIGTAGDDWREKGEKQRKERRFGELAHNRSGSLRAGKNFLVFSGVTL
jgi:hypothetical protein